MRDSRPLRKGWERLLSAWTRNDGKPREEWAPGVDLKETVMIGLLVVVVIVLLGLLAYALVKPF
tara:strand:+ start:985 stop:1176 length:192 start_codon:yes stop_codon:yes gene_type:complete